MFDDVSEFLNQSLLYPIVFIFACMFIYIAFGTILYYRFLARWVPEIFAKLAGFVGSVYILFLTTDHFDWVRGFVANWSIVGILISFAILIVLFAVLVSFLKPKGNKTISRKRKISKSKVERRSAQRQSSGFRSDDLILSCPLDELNGFEFERLLALYFRDHDYEVKEVGVGGNDGGVDLVITDQRGEKTAVQAKCYSERNNVTVQTVRELVAAKRNHDCILSLLVTTSDLTPPAKKEAEQFKVDYWHGGVLQHKLSVWGKWQPSKKKMKSLVRTEIRKAQTQVAIGSTLICRCGADMVRRKSKDGRAFWGCSTFPKCRYTRSISE